MDNPSINIKSKYCEKHNQQIRYYDKNGKNPYCEGCLLQKGELITLEQIQKQQQEIIFNECKEHDSQLQQLYTLRDRITKYKEIIITSLNKSIQQIIDQINIIQSQKQSMQQLDAMMNKYKSIDDLTTYLNKNQKTNRQFRNQILMNLLQDFKSNIMKIDFLHSILSYKQQIILQTQVPQYFYMPDMVLGKSKRPKKMEYELIQKVKCEEWIYAFAIDQRNNILIAGMSDGYIKFYNFQNGKLGAEIQSMQAHADEVCSLYCMKNTHCLVSGSFDNSIKIWWLDKNNIQKVQQTLDGHQNSVTQLIMNSQEDLLISGSTDSTVKFWRKLAISWALSQNVAASGDVLALSLNKNEVKLIACTSSNQIIVMNIQSDQKWKIIQIIQVNEYGLRLCFTIQDQFVFQPETSDYIEVYDYDNYTLQFYQKTKVKIQSIAHCRRFFPCQYIKNLNMLIVKHGQFINILKVDQNGEYQLIQSIEYPNECLYGRMTDDCEQLITWDKISKEIKVRKLTLKE